MARVTTGLERTLALRLKRSLEQHLPTRTQPGTRIASIGRPLGDPNGPLGLQFVRQVLCSVASPEPERGPLAGCIPDSRLGECEPRRQVEGHTFETMGPNVGSQGPYSSTANPVCEKGLCVSPRKDRLLGIRASMKA